MIWVLRRENDPGVRAASAEPDFTDAELAFGNEMKMRAGEAFGLGDESRGRSVRVGNQFVEMGGVPVLIEAVEFKELKPVLARLAACPNQIVVKARHSGRAAVGFPIEDDTRIARQGTVCME